MTDPAGNVAYVGDAEDVDNAINEGYDGEGHIITAYDSSQCRFSYTYSTLNGTVRLTQVKAETKTGGSWGSSPTGVTTACQVDYSYYGDESRGDIGDLKQVKITTRLNDSNGETQVKRKHYRYFEGSADDTPNYSGGNPGYPHQIKRVFDFEGARQADLDDGGTINESYLGVADSTALDAFVGVYLEYDSGRRVIKAWNEGNCGCGGGTNGVHNFTYAANANYSNGSGYDVNWASRTITEKPDGGYLTQYFDELGQGLSQVLTDADPSATPTKTWATSVVRDSNGCVISVRTPENMETYTHNQNLGSPSTPYGVIADDTDAGLVHAWVRTPSGTLTGFATDWKHLKGTGGTAYFDGSQTFTTLSKTIGDHIVARPLITSRTVYSEEITRGSSGAYTTSYSYTDYTGDGQPLTVKAVTQTNPTVVASHNGADSATTSARHFNKDGRVDFTKHEDGIIDYTEYTDGQVTRTIKDCDTGLTGGGQELAGVTIPSGFSSSGTEVRWKTTITYTNAGIRVMESPPGSNHVTYRSVLADGRMVVLNYADFVSGSPDTYYGPVSFAVLNHAGSTEASGIVALTNNATTTGLNGHVDEADDDPITALDLGSVVRLRTALYSETGAHETESREYSLIPGSSPGSAGTNYDATTYFHDELGRQIRVKDPTGTISRQTYDLRSNVREVWTGLNDYGLPGGETSGSSDLEKVEDRKYDLVLGTETSGLNNRLSMRSSYNDGSSKDDVENTFDYQGREIVVKPKAAPFMVNKYDNMGRIIATGYYSSSSGLGASTDPTSTTSNRQSLSETYFDEMGRVWKTVRHKLSTGSSTDTLLTLNWYDGRGRLVKTDGAQLSKTQYDRLGRMTDEYILAVDNDSNYSDVVSSGVTGVAGDIVLEQRETRYDATTGAVLLEATISRFHSDVDTGETTGALDTNGDTDALKLTASDVKGRVQITAKWYDSFERLIDQVEYGTYGGSTFDRNSLSTPARSDTALRTTWTYNTDGTVDTITDPKAFVTKRFYDGEGRLTKEVRNYDVGVNSGNPYGTDQNVTVAYGYTNGLRTSLTAVMQSGGDNQVTTYIYGTTAGTPSQMKISSGHLLRAVKYPDSTNTGTTSAHIASDSSDVVSFAYDAQGREVYKKDQGGNIIETDYDENGRATQKRVTTLGSGFDGAVRRIMTTYDALGRTSLVTQYDNATVGSGSVVDEVGYTYDEWGNVSKFKQDRNSAISGDEYTVSYAWAKATTGRNTLRKTSVTLPSGATYGYNYRSRDGLHDAEVSRVTDITSGTTPLVLYDYNGLGMVVGQKYAEPAVQWKEFTSTVGDYADLDRFNRVVKSRWTKLVTGTPDFYHVEISYDRNSNTVTAEDSVHTGFDVLYTMDSINRLTEAKEGDIAWSGVPPTPTVSTCTRDQQWTLTHTGNWSVDKVDLNGDLDFSDTDELNDSRAHDKVNQLNTRDTDTAGGVNYTLAYDGPGNLTDDGESYKYEWDAFYRLRKVKNQSNNLVAEYRYNGLGFRIAEHADTDTDGDVDGNDKWYYDAFDEAWRQVARFRESDTSPKEEFLHHQAGLDGHGGSSYIDLVALRNKDANTAWTSASDGTLEERVYYCQNWRADVRTLVYATGAIAEWAQYSAYGSMFGLPGGDADSDGDCDASDLSQIQSLSGTSYDVRGDVNLDGVIDSGDIAAVQGLPYWGSQQAESGAFGITANTRGFGGAHALSDELWSNRGRSYDMQLGRWLSRDAKQYVDGPNLYSVLGHNPTVLLDPMGHSCTSCGSSIAQAGQHLSNVALHNKLMAIAGQACDYGSIAPNSLACDLTYGNTELTVTLCSSGAGWSSAGGFSIAGECGFPSPDLLIPGVPAVVLNLCYVCVTIKVRPACMCKNTPDNPMMNCHRACMMCQKLRNGVVTPQDDLGCKDQCEDEMGDTWSPGDCAAVAQAFLTCATVTKIEITCWPWAGFVYPPPPPPPPRGEH